MQYYRTGNWLWGLNRLWGLIVPGVLAFSGFSARLRNLARRLGKFWFLTIGLYIILFLAIVFLIDLPLSYYQGFVRQHAYGLSNQTLSKWLRDSLIGLVIQAAACVAFLWVPYLLLAKSPRRWWIYTAILLVPFLFLTMLVKPIWIDPLFNEFGPMKNKELEAVDPGAGGPGRHRGEPGLRGRQKRRHEGGQCLCHRLLAHQAHCPLGHPCHQAREPELLFVMGHEMGHYVWATWCGRSCCRRS